MFACAKALVLTAAGRREDALALLQPIEPDETFDVSRQYALLIYPYLRSHDVFTKSLRGHPRFERAMDDIRSR